MESHILISSFLGIAACPSALTAKRYLQATGWNLEEALQLFFLGTEGGGLASSSSALSPSADISPTGWGDDTVDGDCMLDEDVHANAHFARQHLEQSEPQCIRESNESTASTTNGSCDSLAFLFQPPFALLYIGPFEKAKIKAAQEDKWLLVNLQSNDDFSSHMLNRDTRSNETVAQIIHSNFIFWQVCQSTIEGKKVRTFYNLDSVPAVLVIEPNTGQGMHVWSGMIQPVDLMQGLLPYIDSSPSYYVTQPSKRPRTTARTSTLAAPDEKGLQSLEASMEGMSIAGDGETIADKDSRSGSNEKSLEASMEGMSVASDDETITDKDSRSGSDGKPMYLPLPDEPQGSRELLCMVRIRLPDGSRVQRNFLRTDSIKLLWSFCRAQLGEAESRLFHFTLAIPGASRSLEHGSDQTFEESGFPNSLVTLVWE